MNKFYLLLDKFVTDESGQDLIEYALIAGLISLVAITTITTIGTTVGNIFTSISTKLSAAAPAGN